MVRMQALEIGQPHYEIPALTPGPFPEARGRRSLPLAGPVVRLAAVAADYLLAFALWWIGSHLIQRPADLLAAGMTSARWFVLVTLAVAAAQVVLLSVRGQTLGKLAVGVRIVDSDDGSNPGFARAVLKRTLVPWLLYLIPLAGAAFFGADNFFILGHGHRCAHDVFANTRVVDLWAEAGRLSSPNSPGSTGRTRSR